MFYSILLTFCHLICKLSSSSAILDTFIQSGGIPVPEHFHWNHSSVASTVLYCPNCCTGSCIRSQFATDAKALCCIAEARPFWTFPENKNVTVPLEIKFYINHTELVDIHPSNETVNVVRHINGNFTILPDNICNFPRLVEIDLRGNKIKTLINLRCIPFLDYLNLDNNRIKTVGASSFVGMAYLRHLSLSHNLINVLEPGAFKYRPGSLSYIYLDWNFLTTMDLSNAALGYFFRLMNFSENQMSKITNELNWTGFKQEDTIGGGDIDLRGNNFSRVPPFTELGINYLQPVLKGTFNYALFLEENPFSCDCEAYIYVTLAFLAMSNFDGLQFNCASPPSLRGYSPKKFRKNPIKLNYLICNISLEDKCPTKCYCYKQPSQKRVVVNCSSTDRSMMPKVVPDFDDLDIDLSYNLIDVFTNLNYLKRAKRIDLSYNRITFIDPAVYGIEKLSVINLSHNQITRLDRSVQLKDPCKLWFGNVTLTKCNCEMRWIKVWLQRQYTQECNIENLITCQKDEKSIDLMLLSEVDLCPIAQTYVVHTWFAIAAPFIMIISGILYYNFRFEVKLLLKRVKLYLHCHKSSENLYENLYENDLYVSFNMNNSDVRTWTVQNLIPFLENQGYTICLPPRDFNIGAIHAEEIYEKVSTSKSFVVVLSQDYERSQFQTIEWKHIWNMFMANSVATITVINYDFLKSKDIIDRKLKSFLRLGYSLNFCNFHKNLMSDIQVNIGPPMHQETAVFWAP